MIKRLWPVPILLFLVYFVVLACVYGLSDGKTCPTCNGTGKTVCTSCDGTGTCSWCGGSGKEIIFNPDQPCPLCNGTGDCGMCEGTGLTTCRTCYGSGWYWMYAPAGSSLLLSTIFSLCFIGAFSLEYIIDAFRLSMNPWVNTIENMDFWFNPMFFTWLFGRNRKRWAKWTTATSLITAIPLGIVFGAIALAYRANDVAFWVGSITGLMFVTLLAVAWYQNL